MWTKSSLLSLLQSWFFVSLPLRAGSLIRSLASMRWRKRPKTSSARANEYFIEWEMIPYSFRLSWFEMKDPSSSEKGLLPKSDHQGQTLTPVPSDIKSARRRKLPVKVGEPHGGPSTSRR